MGNNTLATRIMINIEAKVFFCLDKPKIKIKKVKVFGIFAVVMNV